MVRLASKSYLRFEAIFSFKEAKIEERGVGEKALKKTREGDTTIFKQ